ncbi:MAG: chemotaxis protein methyltransferase CheR [Thermotogota bacterium]|nr:chemotaxis protein methyltransferase CheR [Thermotogota bacterium]MDK2865333.1 chemotaxis protein methyltransferase CheR [Thermotogota bacterium]
MFEVNDPEFDWFLQQVKKHLNIDLTGYKQHRVHRRVNMLLRRHNVESYREYLKMILGDQKFRDEFLDKMTINVTEFFRNPEKWRELQDYIKDMVRDFRGFRAWSAGCSTGEEPYTIAMILEELRAPSRASVLATDLDPWVLEKAKRGIYEERSMVNLDEAMRNRYFIKHDDGTYEIKPFVKSRVTFKRHDLILEPYENGFSLIVCRNVVIYFDQPTKDKIYRKFVEALNTGGYLFVGSTERIFNYRELGLEMVSPFIYRKRG